jgi:hypothetical protein
MDTKPWYLSVTVWGAILTGASTLMTVFHHPFNVDGLDNEIVTLIGSGMAIFGRFKAKTQLTWK